MSLLLFILPKHSVAIWAKITIKSTNFDPINNVRTLFDLKSFNHTRLTFRGVSHNYSELFKNRRCPYSISNFCFVGKPILDFSCKNPFFLN